MPEHETNPFGVALQAPSLETLNIVSGYSFAKKSYDEQYADLSRRLDEAVQRRSKFSEAMSVDNKWITLMKSVSTATRLTQDLVDESIELVKVHENGAIELIMKYGDLYALTLQSIKEVQEAM